MRGTLLIIKVETDLWVTSRMKKKTRKQLSVKALFILEMKARLTKMAQFTSLEESNNSLLLLEDKISPLS